MRISYLARGALVKSINDFFKDNDSGISLRLHGPSFILLAVFLSF